MAGIVALAAGLAAHAPAAARACSNAVAEVEPTVAGVKEAEELLNDGDPGGARDRVSRVLPALKPVMRADPDGEIPDAGGLRDRAARILALADVRLDPGGPGDGRRRAVLDKAVKELGRLAEEHPKDPARQTDLAEALARTRPAEARNILEDLAERGIVTTPYGYAALARLRGADGDSKGRDQARVRCELMAKTSSICRLEPLPLAVRMAFPGAVMAAVVVVAAVAARRAAAATKTGSGWRSA